MIVLYYYYRTLCAVFQGKHESFFAFFAERGAPPSYIGLPQRFCEAKDLWEEREGGKGKSGYSGSYSLRRDVGFNNPSVSLPRQAFGQRNTVSRGRDRAALLPTQLLRICAGALKRRALCAVSKLANGQRHTVALPRKHLLAPYTGEAKIGKRAARRQLFFVMSSFIFPRTGGR